MARAPKNVLVLPFRRMAPDACEFAVFLRRDPAVWQAVAGGVEVGESFAEAARRELLEETGIDRPLRWIALDACASVPAAAFKDNGGWGPDVYVVMERAFGVEVAPDAPIALSAEHSACEWLPYGAASARLRWDSNRTALWELDARLAREAGVSQ